MPAEPTEFWLEPEVADLAELHITQIRKLEDAEALRVMKRYREIRHELRDRLDSLPRGSFSAQQVRAVMLQIELALAEMNKRLLDGMGDAVQASAEIGIEHLIKELNKWQKKFSGQIVPINLNAVVVASDTRNFLYERYQSSLDGYRAAVQSVFSQEVTRAAIEQIPTFDLVQRLGQATMMEEWKLNRLVRTELHNVYNIGKIKAMQELRESEEMPDLMKTLMHPMDQRTGEDSKYAASLQLVVPIDEPFVYKWRGETRSFMAPPDRPNDRAILVPYRKGWREGGAYIPTGRLRVYGPEDREHLKPQKVRPRP
jgi:hypothetical protein